MYKLTQTLAESLDRYFKTLKSTGYVKYNNVYKLLTALFIKRILNGEFGVLISEEDYKTLDSVLCCILGSNCLMPYITYKQDTIISKEYMPQIPIITEDQTIKITEDNTTRLVL